MTTDRTLVLHQQAVDVCLCVYLFKIFADVTIQAIWDTTHEPDSKAPKNQHEQLPFKKKEKM